MPTDLFVFLLVVPITLTASEPATPNPRYLDRPRWLLGPRLVKLGEQVEFQFFLLAGIPPGEVKIFPRYLEQSSARAESFTTATEGLGWIETLPGEKLPLTFTDGRAVHTYQPAQPGSHLARWQIGSETLYRYFAVVTDEYTVVRYTTGDDWQPNWHSTGIAIEYRMAADQFTPDTALVKLYQDYQQTFGDGVVPLLFDTSDLSVEERAATYGTILERVGALLPDPSDLRAVHGSERDYAITLWGLPAEFNRTADLKRIQTNAKECILAWNTAGEYHLVLIFDLQPGAEVQVTIRP